MIFLFFRINPWIQLIRYALSFPLPHRHTHTHTHKACKQTPLSNWSKCTLVFIHHTHFALSVNNTKMIVYANSRAQGVCIKHSLAANIELKEFQDNYVSVSSSSHSAALPILTPHTLHVQSPYIATVKAMHEILTNCLFVHLCTKFCVVLHSAYVQLVTPCACVMCRNQY